jgi:3-deoxy-D-manno-octulosonate 8-phosphate phosphatase (KDO 8-P phosphatase)
MDWSRFAAVVTDVDGVLTDGRIGLDSTGGDVRFFHMRDGMGTRLLMQAGVRVGWLSAGTDTGSIRARAKMLGVEYVDVGLGEKGARFEAMCRQMGVEPSKTIYLGDDVNDLPAMELAGLKVCPADAHEDVRAVADVVLGLGGGAGCFRELADEVLRAK